MIITYGDKMKRTRSDSIAGQLAAMDAALSDDIMPPDHITLDDSELPFWRSIVRARAKARWNDSDLEAAGNLARCKADIERVQREIREEGDIITNERGTPIMNPKHTLLEILSRRCMALSRMLHVHAEATQGKARDQVKQNELQSGARDAMGESDDLIPRPRSH